MKLLELFSGSCTVSEEAKRRGYEVRNLDICSKNNPTYCCDIITWNYKEDLKDWKPDVIWASPDCRSWSIAQHKHRKSNLIPLTQVALDGEAMVLKTLEIIEWLNPSYYFLENPRGYLRKFPPMKDISFRNTVFYGNYDYPMCKPTDIFSNIELPIEKIPNKSNFDYMPNSKSHNRYFENNKKTRALIPTKLISSILDQI
jgi:hypothetical protein